MIKEAFEYLEMNEHDFNSTLRLNKYFTIHEFVPKEYIGLSNNILLRMININLINLIYFMRERYQKPIIINNWHTGGKYNYSGVRPTGLDFSTLYSAHIFGCAADIKIEQMSPNDIRSDILKNQDEFIKEGLTVVEKDTPTWTHVSVENTRFKKVIWIPNPRLTEEKK